ncbi:hypothetical protein MMC07_003910 [Pseudocyphellaria aurata]|nr:hypothetical protein [Pseudocyphellaria aurata]
MDHAQAVLAGTEAPTVEDFIEWHEEEAFRSGDLGFTTGFYSTDEFYKSWSDVADLHEAFSVENYAQEAMEQLHTEHTRLQQRSNIMQSNPDLLALTEIEVHRRLLQAGNSELDVADYVSSKASLREKIVKLHELEHGTGLRKPGGVRALVSLGAKLEQTITVMLPIEASLSEVCRLLEGIRETDTPFLDDSPTCSWAVDAESVWKYHLIDRDTGKLLKGKSVRLLTDQHYRQMIAQTTSQGRNITAVLALADPPRQPEQSNWVTVIEQMNIDEKNAKVVLDENGEPFFDPLDWSKMAQKDEDEMRRQHEEEMKKQSDT